jgi:hypothetical protein
MAKATTREAASVKPSILPVEANGPVFLTLSINSLIFLRGFAVNSLVTQPQNQSASIFQGIIVVDHSKLSFINAQLLSIV